MGQWVSGNNVMRSLRGNKIDKSDFSLCTTIYGSEIIISSNNEILNLNNEMKHYFKNINNLKYPKYSCQFFL